MRKSIFMIVWCLTLAVPAFALNKAPVKELIVASDGEFTTISAALASLPDPNPDTNPVIIKVMPGTYSEGAPVYMKSNVHLQGSSHSVTKITLSVATNPGGMIISNVSNVEISDFTIENTINRDSVHIESSSVTVRNNRFVGGYPIGIWNTGAQGPSQALITENIFDWPNSYCGIYVLNSANSSQLTISQNKFVMKENPGINIYGGIRLLGDNSANVVDNIFVGDGSPTNNAILAGSGKVFISGNIIDNIGGRGIDAGSQTVIRGNTITNLGDYGINAYAVAPIISGNIIKGNGYGIRYGSGTITNNEIVGNGQDVEIWYPVNLNFNTFDSITGVVPSSLNVKSDGTSW